MGKKWTWIDSFIGRIHYIISKLRGEHLTAGTSSTYEEQAQ